jgi:hypothetical protein
MLEDIKQKKLLRTYPTKVDQDVVYLSWPTNNPSSVKVRF